MSKEKDELYKKRHSLCHLMSMAVVELYPKAGLGVGPAIDDGFYQDYDLPEAINDTILPKLEKRMRELIKENIAFVQHTMNFDEARKLYTHDPYKTELINDLEKAGEKNVSFFKSGNFDNLCLGPHVGTTKEINPDAFKLTMIAGSYWRGDENKQMLTRIYGIAFNTKEELEAHLKMLEEAKKRDHKKLGIQLDLFTFSDLVGAGLPLWTPKGTLLRTLLDDFVWQLRSAHDYSRVEIPHITKKDLYIKSGHWEKFKDELFRITTREGHEFAMKPMNCPHHTQIYARKQWSYRDLPQRYANTTMCYRDEQSGELSGLSRARSFTQDDAHVFCRMVQAREEFLKIWDIVYKFYNAFGLSLRVRLSLHDPSHMEKYLGDEERWKMAEGILREIVVGKKNDWFEGIGEAAFYGPKLDFMAKDSLGRELQVATIQLDVNMPDRFDLYCINEKNEKERIVMIHAAIMGSIERFLSVMIEHYAGAFPVWLSPVQVAILPISDKHIEYAKGVAVTLQASGVRVELHEENDTLGKKIRSVKEQKTPYMLVIGDAEVKDGTVTVEHREKGKIGALNVDKFVANIKEEIINRN